MKCNKRFIASIIEIAVGLGLLLLRFFDVIDDFWSGMGTALIVVGALQLIRHIRYKTNETYKAAVDVELNDERNKFLSMKAWSWAGYLFVMIAAVAAIVLKICGLDEYVFFASGSVCLMIVLYWVSYMIVRKKY